jgi:MFS transporter, OPA family, glycerol-3-phosphate transporter
LNAASVKPAAPETASRERLVLWVLWLTYGSFYFGRNNLGLAVPGISAELGYTKAQMGTVLMALKLAYGVGQFVNGQLAERIPPRRLLALGLLASAGLNVLFGWVTALYFMTFIWACNGYVQALGWAPCVRVTANWFPGNRRGRAMGIIGTGYQLCGALTFVVAGWAADKFGWRGAMFVPSVLLAASAAHMWFLLEETPRASGSPTDNQSAAAATRASLSQNLAVTLSNPWLWFVAVTLGLLDSCRYGYTDWGVMHLTEIQKSSVSSAAFKYAVLPFGGMAGAYLAGWATDRFFGGRRVPVIATLLGVLALLTLVFDSVIRWGLGASIVMLFLVGFCIFGPQVLLVGTLPADLARRGTAAAAAGFVNFMGYMGAAAGNQLTGQLAQHRGWPVAVRFWAGCALASALVIVCLWPIERQRSKTPARPAD